MKAIKHIFGEIIKRFQKTSLGMWYFNKKNGVEIISEAEYNRLVKMYNRNVVIIL